DRAGRPEGARGASAGRPPRGVPRRTGGRGPPIPPAAVRGRTCRPGGVARNARRARLRQPRRPCEPGPRWSAVVGTDPRVLGDRRGRAVRGPAAALVLARARSGESVGVLRPEAPGLGGRSAE